MGVDKMRVDKVGISSRFMGGCFEVYVRNIVILDIPGWHETLCYM